MTKAKILMIFFVIVSSLIIFPNKTNAVTVTSEKVVTSTNGSVDYIIKGLELEEQASYQWAIEKTQDAQITNWYDVTAPDYTTGTIKISISISNENQLAILKTTDTAYVTVRKVGETINLLENYKVDLSLPILKTFGTGKSDVYRGIYEIVTIYGMKASNVSFKFEKITDVNIINNYIDNNHDLSGLDLKGIENFPSLSDTTWKSVHQKYSYNVESEKGQIIDTEVPAENGLYYLWLLGNEDGIKTLYGQAIVEVGEVTKINTNTGNNDNSNSNNNNNNQNQQTSGITNSGTSNSGTKDNKTSNSGTTNNGIQNNSNQKDTTIATGTMPKAGITTGIILIEISVVGIVIFTYYRYNKLKDIK